MNGRTVLMLNATIARELGIYASQGGPTRDLGVIDSVGLTSELAYQQG